MTETPNRPIRHFQRLAFAPIPLVSLPTEFTLTHIALTLVIRARRAFVKVAQILGVKLEIRDGRLGLQLDPHLAFLQGNNSSKLIVV